MIRRHGGRGGQSDLAENEQGFLKSERWSRGKKGTRAFHNRDGKGHAASIVSAEGVSGNVEKKEEGAYRIPGHGEGAASFFRAKRGSPSWGGRKKKEKEREEKFFGEKGGGGRFRKRSYFQKIRPAGVGAKKKKKREGEGSRLYRTPRVGGGGGKRHIS